MLNMVEGLEGSAAQEIDAPESATDSTALATHLLSAPSAIDAELTTVQLAAACAELDLVIDAEEAKTKQKAVRLAMARALLAERFTNEGVSGIRVTTSQGRRLVHLTSIFAPSVPAERRDDVFEWVKANHPELVTVGYNDAALRAKLKTWFAAQEGDFPQALVDAGAIKVYQGVEVRFRKSN
jgi:hypothetical protein